MAVDLSVVLHLTSSKFHPKLKLWDVLHLTMPAWVDPSKRAQLFLRDNLKKTVALHSVREQQVVLSKVVLLSTYVRHVLMSGLK